MITNDLTGVAAKTDLLLVSLSNPDSSVNAVHKVYTTDASSLVNCPITSSGTTFIGKWECIYYQENRVMVKINEFYPRPGRIWTNHYNWTQWAGWHSNSQESWGGLSTPTGIGCSISDFYGAYQRIGRLVYFQLNMKMTPNGTGTTEIEIPCLPFTTNFHVAFSVGFCDAYFNIDPSSTTKADGIIAGAYGNSRNIKIGFAHNGRTWYAQQGCLTTAGIIAITGTYLTDDE